MRGSERALALGVVTVLCVGGCGGSRATPVGMGGNLPPGLSSQGRTIQMSQLYLAPILIDEVGNVLSYPAIYLWNQPTDSVNMVPEWVTFP